MIKTDDLETVQTGSGEDRKVLEIDKTSGECLKGEIDEYRGRPEE